MVAGLAADKVEVLRQIAAIDSQIALGGCVLQ